jgi:hypothetical protein
MWHAIFMTVHVLGLIAVFAGFSIQHRAGARLRQAVRSDGARPWSEQLEATRPMVPSGTAMLLVSGVFLSAPMRFHLPPWVVVSIASVILIGLAGRTFGRRFAAMERAVPAEDGPLSHAAMQTIHNPVTWALHAAANGAALATIWLMTAKPGWVQSILLVVAAVATGAIVGARTAVRSDRRESHEPSAA